MIPAVMNNFVLLCGIGSFAMFLIDALTRLKSDTISLVAINAIIYTANTTNVLYRFQTAAALERDISSSTGIPAGQMSWHARDFPQPSK